MIVDVTKNGYQEGYVEKGGVGVFHPFFATANAAFRRDALIQAGGFDLKCETGEDVDVCQRVAAAGYELWFEPSARITHHHRSNLRGLLKQWFDYGWGHSYLFKKQMPQPRLHVYCHGGGKSGHSVLDIRRLADLPSPFHGMIFLTSFHLMHFSLAAGLIAALAGWKIAAWALFAVAAGAAVRYFGIQFDPKAPGRSLLFAGIRYLADCAYTLGGLLGGIRDRTLYVEAVRSRRRSG